VDQDLLDEWAEAGEAYCPWWYNGVRATRALQGAVRPWEWYDELPEIAQRPEFWMEAAIVAQNAEIGAQNERGRKADNARQRTLKNANKKRR